MSSDASPHLLRGEDASHYTFTLDRLDQGLQGSEVSVRAGGGRLTVVLGQHTHGWDLPADVDLHGQAEAVLEAGKLTIRLTKKHVEGGLEAQARLKAMAMADNRLLVVPVTVSSA